MVNLVIILFAFQLNLAAILVSNQIIVALRPVTLKDGLIRNPIHQSGFNLLAGRSATVDAFSGNMMVSVRCNTDTELFMGDTTEICAFTMKSCFPVRDLSTLLRFRDIGFIGLHKSIQDITAVQSLLHEGKQSMAHIESC